MIKSVHFDQVGDIAFDIIEIFKKHNMTGYDMVALMHIICNLFESHYNVSGVDEVGSKEDIVKLMEAQKFEKAETPLDDKPGIEDFIENVPNNKLLSVVLYAILVGIKNDVFNYKYIREAIDKFEKKFPDIIV